MQQLLVLIEQFEGQGATGRMEVGLPFGSSDAINESSS
jgi:hypothetical protein